VCITSPLLGVGGWGEVYCAHDKALAALNRPHIAQVFGLEPHGENRVIAMERMDGPTLTGAIGGRESARPWR